MIEKSLIRRFNPYHKALPTLKLKNVFLFFVAADNHENLLPLPETGYRVQDAGDQLPDDLQGAHHDAAEQSENETPRPEAVLLDHGGRRPQIR